MHRGNVCSTNKPINPVRERKHMCGKCMTPHADEGNPACPGRASQQAPLSPEEDDYAAEFPESPYADL